MEKLREMLVYYLAIFAVTSTVGVFTLQNNESCSKCDFILDDDVLQEPLPVGESEIPVDLNMTGLVYYYGYTTESHTVVTKDGYILQVFRITKEDVDLTDRPVAFLQHGILSSSIDWIIVGPEKSIAFLLFEAGYDVWLGNARGNRYSRKHQSLTTDDKKYWNFSWHEIGVHDLPAMIDYVLKETGRKKLFYIGHSQGTTSFYVMASSIPSYNDKIQAMFSFAPVAYSSRMKSPIVRFPAKYVNNLQFVFKLIGINEFKPTNEFMKKFENLICKQDSFSPVCTNLLFLIGGFNKDQFDLDLLPLILTNFPAGSSVKQLVHYGQIINSGKFTRYDFGTAGNLLHYGTRYPPSYQIKNIRAPVSLHCSGNDWLSNLTDVQILYSQLPNPIGIFEVPDKKFNHFDYILGEDAKELLYDMVISLMEKYKKNCVTYSH